MPITPLPTAPSRATDTPAQFVTKADAWVAALPVFGTELNAAAAAFAVTQWNAATAYVVGDRVWSPIDYQTYRRKTNGTTATDPSADTTNWANISAFAAAQILGSALGAFVTMVNGTISHSRSGNAETVAIKTKAGADPTPGDPVLVVFRNVTPATGDYTVITLTAATSITINNTATMGMTNGVAARLWIVGFNDGGTFRLGVINCLSGTNIYPLSGFGIASSTAMGVGADSAHVFYTGSAVTAKAYRVLGYSTWESGLAAIGVWDTAPTRTHLFGAGVPLPGMVIGRSHKSISTVVTCATVMPNDNTIPQNTEGDEVLALDAYTPSSAANLLKHAFGAGGGKSASSGSIGAALFQDSTAGALRARQTGPGATNARWNLNCEHSMIAGTTSATTFKWRVGSDASTAYVNGDSGGTRLFGGVDDTTATLEEIMA